MKRKKQTNFIINFLMFAFAFLFLFLAGRYMYIQVTGEVQDVSLTEWADAKRETSIPIKAERGIVYDKSGMLLAYNQPAYRLYAILDAEYSSNKPSPLHVVDPEDVAKRLSPHLAIDEKEIIQIIKNGQKAGRFQVEFGMAGKNLTQQQMEDIKALQIPGIHFAEEATRYYPNGVFASHVIGFAQQSEDNGLLEGVIGIEREKNKLLTGEDGFIQYERDKYDKKLLQSRDVVQDPENGHDIYLTIDQKIQTVLEDVLSEVDEQYEPERITAVVMNPKTGEIVAIGNRPSFNPNEPNDVENWYNDVISTPFEPGSTSKIFTWAAAIDSGVYNGSELFNSGKYVVNEKIERIHDHNKTGWGAISYDEGFRRSSNVAASKLVWEKMGTETFLEYLERFLLDQITEVDLPNEVAGKILYNWPSEKIRTSFGQGSTVTPLQQVKAASAIANGGKMVKPYVIDKIVDPNTDEVMFENEPTYVGEPISEDTAEQMLDLLESVVNSDDGTGKPYRLQSYTVAGKTGTAQIPDSAGNGYLAGENNNIFSFLGMAPKDDPQLIMHVSITRPKLKENESGSVPVSFIFNNVMENGLHYLNIEPDKEAKTGELKTVTMPSVEHMDVATAEKKMKDIGLRYTVVGNGKKIVATNVLDGDVIYPNKHVLLITDNLTMPDMTDWSKQDVLAFAHLVNIRVETTGSGYVVKQSIEKGKTIKEDAKLTVELESSLNKKKEKK